MTGEGIAAIIGSFSTLAIAIANSIVILSNNRKSSDERAALHDKMDQVQNSTDGMKDKLVAEVRNASFNAGVKSETDKQEQP